MIEALSAMEGILSQLVSLATAATPPSAPAAASTAAAPGTSSFAEVFNAAVGRLDDNVASANAAAKAFASGANDIPLSDVMLSLEKANLALQMASNVRDKVVAAYSNVMNMQL